MDVIAFLLTTLLFPSTFCEIINSKTISEPENLGLRFGLGKHVCSLPLDKSVYKIGILVPFDPRLENIHAAAPTDQVLSNQLLPPHKSLMVKFTSICVCVFEWIQKKYLEK